MLALECLLDDQVVHDGFADFLGLLSHSVLVLLWGDFEDLRVHFQEFLRPYALKITTGDLDHHEEFTTGEALVVIIEGIEGIMVLKGGSRGLIHGEVLLGLVVLLLGLVHILFHCRELVLVSREGLVVVWKWVELALPNGSDSDNAKVPEEEVET